ncbi:L-arabonate dehydratase [Penicillium canariense]|uniref:L-arabonate dehydratase n=1 Tax=Penicillium canariense TaxID=189055 RepID=A0A9W9HKD6_9EURO|nr:L-arabonate dehydratase [Penicillium canariense]KAJ5151518.1 L-arabonate dehydratase [Penicillium canariense]
MRGVGLLGYLGAAEVVNMHLPGRLLNLEAAAGGNLAILRNGDKLRIDVLNRRVDILISHEEIAQRRKEVFGTLWQEIFRQETDQLSSGMVLKKAVKYQRLAQTNGPLRHNH